MEPIKRKTDISKLKTPLLSLILLTTLAILLFTSTETNNSIPYITRNPAVAGTFYPASKTSLKNTIKTYYKNVKDSTPKDVYAIIVPHAGYVYSGQTAAFAYKNIPDKETILLLAPSHHIYFRGASIANVTHYKTPLGEIKLSEKTGSIRQALNKASLLYTGKNPHKKEHAIEVQLPFLQVGLTGFEIIPILIGSATDYTDTKKIADILKKYTDKSTLIVISSDFTHYGPRYNYIPFTENKEENIKNLDYGALEHIEKKDPESFHNYIQKTGATICGSKPITILLEMIQENEPGLKGKLMHYDTSGRITGDYTNSVSYISYIFYKDNTLNKEEQKYLTTLARNTLESYLKDKKTPKINKNVLSEKLTQKSGCFVTLTKDSQLRGCIGHILAQKPLYQCIIDNSISAAVRDSRFSPTTYDELDDIHVEVSVLSIPRVLEFTSPDELLDKLTPLEDGVIISYGFHKSTYLPQVWEQLPDKVEFLTSLCKKGGAPGDCWKKENVKIETYQAQVFWE
ncbi:MAG: hypothetical protein DRN71_01780 [Candidatus Nanohalarchaeota archaeon]|nr:MAG: hypothetical protein DRN71_01780 [Candidatus Nanohaloarchaeota archaeon]